MTDTSTTTEKPGGTRLDDEGEIAADYLEELLDIADLDGDIDIDVRHGRAAVEIVADDSGSLAHLVGKDGEVLEALQELTRLAVQAKTGDRSRLMLDVAGYRAARRVELVAMATAAIASVRATGAEVALEPLNAFERKVVHDAVAEAGLVSDSRGVEPYRYVVVQAGGPSPDGGGVSASAVGESAQSEGAAGVESGAEPAGA
jgi:spoIIIJ-associated protein